MKTTTDKIVTVDVSQQIAPRPYFIPRVGDKVVFRSDRQTEKGPSSGFIIAVDRSVNTVIIKHSDHPGETFQWGDVQAYFVTDNDGLPLWVFR